MKKTIRTKVGKKVSSGRFTAREQHRGQGVMGVHNGEVHRFKEKITERGGVGNGNFTQRES